MVTGGSACGLAIVAGATVGTGSGVISSVLAQPAAWTVPLAAVVMVCVSLADYRHIPRGTDRFMRRLHVPERPAIPAP